ncbi:MAG: hypothetical protein LC799_36110, partial [Actinobacteria bacterium]|nr:hypothetical protein [Actinomycetota bacterium]
MTDNSHQLWLNADAVEALLECQAELPSFDLVDGAMCPDAAELYRTTVLGVPCLRQLIGQLCALLTHGKGPGFAVLG